MTAESSTRELSLIGGTCPWIFREIESHIRAVGVGEIVKLIASPGDQASTIARAVKADGHAVVGITRTDDTVELEVRKADPDRSDDSSECCPGGDCR